MNDDVDEERSCLCLQQVWNIKLLFLPKQIGIRLWAFWSTYLPSVMSQAVAKIPLCICLDAKMKTFCYSIQGNDGKLMNYKEIKHISCHIHSSSLPFPVPLKPDPLLLLLLGIPLKCCCCSIRNQYSVVCGLIYSFPPWPP